MTAPAFLMLLCLALIVLWLGVEAWAYTRRHRPRRLERTDHVAARKRTISRNAFKARMGTR